MTQVAFVACSYDTGHEPIGFQVLTKLRQLSQAFGQKGEVRWSLWIVDDAPPRAELGVRVRAAFRPPNPQRFGS